MTNLIAVALTVVSFVVPHHEGNVVKKAPLKPTLCELAYNQRKEIINRFGIKAAGKNVCEGANSMHEKALYLRSLEALNRPALEYLKIAPGSPLVPPGGVETPHYRPVGLAYCIDERESTFGVHQTPGANHSGIAQWLESTWTKDDGLKYAPTPTQATYDQQLLVLDYGLEHYACFDWCPYDHCG